MDRSPWCDEEMCPQEGHSMPGGNEGVSQMLTFSSAWCSAIVQTGLFVYLSFSKREVLVRACPFYTRGDHD